MNKKVFVKTYGCQMNVYDSQRMTDVLAPLGYLETDTAEAADLVILNTCHIREKAVEKVYSELGKLRDMKAAKAEQGRDMILAVAGCVGQAEGEQITKRMKAVDLVFGPQTYHRLPELLEQRRSKGRAVVETEFSVDDKFAGLGREQVRNPLSRAVTAFLTIQEGCDKFCTFCVVPYTRGAEFSRPQAQVLDEARKLADQGVRELTLLGQNVNAYRGVAVTGAPSSLGKLVAELSLISGIERIRYMTSHPRDMTDDLIEAHGSNPKLMPFLHLPVQSGSDRVLKAMNRGHTANDYLKLIARIRAAQPAIALSGDFIVGFPGETDAEFEASLDLIREVKYASAFSFKYSPRPGTPAAENKNQIPEDAKSGRLARLQAVLAEQTKTFNQACVGLTLPVLVEKPGRRAGQMIGRSPYLQSVHLEIGTDHLGQIVQTQILAVGSNSLSGQYRPTEKGDASV
ncbi:MAG: tRNA (N6-isopentenyl adenosine(37)-C2)-methylthiotransferase MiaB [Alphaproteobacteria bacterium]|nr:tRNA (N6-isopentenyl adenosine(37)-C2)-methylthiotransferase MiaB [Alphaproteobacteria bacterium]